MEARRGGSPYDLSPLYARRPEERVRGLCHPVPRSNLAEAADSPGRPGEEVAAKRKSSPLRSVGRCAGGAWVCTPEGAAAATVSKTHESRGEERTHAGSHRPLAWPALRSQRLAALTLAALRSLGASTRVASLPARARLECGVVIVTLRSGGTQRCL